MKKLMIAVATVSMAVALNAATSLTWTDTALLDPKGNSYEGTGITGWAFAIDGDGYEALNSYVAATSLADTMKLMYSGFDKVNQALSFTIDDTTYTYSSSTLIGGEPATSEDGTIEFAKISGLSSGDENWAAFIFELDSKDAGTADYYMANTAYWEQKSSNKKFDGIANYWNGNDEAGATTWQSVPEPTSGLLLLLGVAGLALRRRRA